MIYNNIQKVWTHVIWNYDPVYWQLCSYKRTLSLTKRIWFKQTEILSLKVVGKRTPLYLISTQLWVGFFSWNKKHKRIILMIMHNFVHGLFFSKSKS